VEQRPAGALPVKRLATLAAGSLFSVLLQAQVNDTKMIGTWWKKPHQGRQHEGGKWK